MTRIERMNTDLILFQNTISKYLIITELFISLTYTVLVELIRAIRCISVIRVSIHRPPDFLRSKISS